MALPTLVKSAVDSWAAYYGNHRMVSVTVRALHLCGLALGGGTALVVDRRVLSVLRKGAAARDGVAAELGRSHRVVVPALALVVTTGLLMTASDTSTFLSSPLYWTKLSLVGLLLLNGTGLLAAERAVNRGRPSGWSWLALVSGLSFALWLVIVYFGVWLTAAA